MARQKWPVCSQPQVENTQGLSRDYDVRPFVMQANETDYEFLTRLWRSEGINWLIDEAEHVVASSAAGNSSAKIMFD